MTSAPTDDPDGTQARLDELLASEGYPPGKDITNWPTEDFIPIDDSEPPPTPGVYNRFWGVTDSENLEGLAQWCHRRLELIRRMKAEQGKLIAGVPAMAAVDHAWLLMKRFGLPTTLQKPLVPKLGDPARAADDAMTFLAECAGLCEAARRTKDEAECSVRLKGEIWHLRYCGETGDYPINGNQAIGWLVKLLAAANRQLTVANLRGDPEKKLAADALMGGQPKMGSREIRDIKAQLEEISTIAEETGWTEALEEKKAELLSQLKGPRGQVLAAPIKADHRNIATQLRTLIRVKLKRDMPQLAAHLKASLKLDFPEFGYYPPSPPPAWQF
jgi:hypothetical protein